MQSFVNMNFDTKRQELLKKSKILYLHLNSNKKLLVLLQKLICFLIFFKVLDSIVNIDLKQFDSELENKIGQIKHKTLIIWGKDDEVIKYRQYIAHKLVNYFLFCCSK